MLRGVLLGFGLTIALWACVTDESVNANSPPTSNKDAGGTPTDAAKPDAPSDAPSTIVEAGPPDPNKLRVFLTKQAYTGDQVGGLEQADAKCSAAGKGVFKAFLSTDTMQASSRFPFPLAKWVSANGKVVFAGDTNALLSTFAFDEDKGNVDPIAFVWTGTDAAGKAVANQTCADWLAGSGLGRVARADAVGPTWPSAIEDAGSPQSCAGVARLLCLEVIPGPK